MPARFARSFLDVIYRARFALLAGAAPRTHDRGEVGGWINARLRRAVP